VLGLKDSAGAAIPGLAADPHTAAVAEPARVAFTDASRVAALTAAGFLVIGLMASLSLGGVRPRRAAPRKGSETTATRPQNMSLSTTSARTRPSAGRS
jgi:hypothetical protein